MTPVAIPSHKTSIMKAFYTRTYLFWVISKIILSVILLFSAIIIMLEGGLQTEEKIVNVFALIEGALLLITLVKDFKPRTSMSLFKVICGGIMGSMAMGLLIVLLTVSEGARSSAYIFGYPMALWMLGVGIFDMLQVKRK